MVTLIPQTKNASSGNNEGSLLGIENDIRNQLEANSDSVKVTLSDFKEDSIKMKLEDTSIDLSVTSSLDFQKDIYTVAGQYEDNNGDIIKVEYDVVINNIDDNNFSADFINKETGEIYKYNSNELQASVAWVPIIVWGVRGIQISYRTYKAGKWVLAGTAVVASSITAKEAIGKYKKGAINREFPTNMYDKTLKEIDKLAKKGNKDAKKAKKLLTDKRFDKTDNRK